jgi:hypothetical protein
MHSPDRKEGNRSIRMRLAKEISGHYRGILTLPAPTDLSQFGAMHFWIKFEQPVPYEYKLIVRLRTRPGRFDPDDVAAGTDRGAYYEFSTENKRGGADWDRLSIPLSTFNKGSGDPTIRDIRQIEITTSSQEGHRHDDAKATFTYSFRGEVRLPAQGGRSGSVHSESRTYLRGRYGQSPNRKSRRRRRALFPSRRLHFLRAANGR